MRDQPNGTDKRPSHVLEKEGLVKKTLEAHQYSDGKTNYTHVFHFF